MFIIDDNDNDNDPILRPTTVKKTIIMTMMAPSPDRQRNSLGVFGFHNFQPVHDMYNNNIYTGILYSYIHMYV
jgi:hypothetical protein